MPRNRPATRPPRLAWRSGVAAAALLVAAALQVAAPAQGAVSGGFPRIDSSARGTALGGSMTALASGPNAIHWNPAGLLHAHRPEVAFTYADLFGLGLVTHTAVEFALPQLRHDIEWSNGEIRRIPRPLPAARAFGVALSGLNGELGEETYRETQVSLAYAGLAPGLLQAGAVYRYLSASGPVAGTGGSGHALDLGFLRPVGPFRIGIAAAGIFSSVRWDEERGTTGPIAEDSDPLPERWSAALAWTPARFPIALTAQQDWRGTSFDRVQTGAAAEWQAARPLVFRGGIRRRHDALGTREDWSAGAGVRVGEFFLDYGLLVNGHDLGDTHRWSAAVRL